MSTVLPININAEQFPAQLKELRAKRSITQKQLAKQAKVSQQTISAIESGRMDPSLKIMIALAVVLGAILMINPFANSSH